MQFASQLLYPLIQHILQKKNCQQSTINKQVLPLCNTTHLKSKKVMISKIITYLFSNFSASQRFPSKRVRFLNFCSQGNVWHQQMVNHVQQQCNNEEQGNKHSIQNSGNQHIINLFLKKTTKNQFIYLFYFIVLFIYLFRAHRNNRSCRFLAELYGV